MFASFWSTAVLGSVAGSECWQKCHNGVPEPVGLAQRGLHLVLQMRCASISVSVFFVVCRVQVGVFGPIGHCNTHISTAIMLSGFDYLTVHI